MSLLVPPRRFDPTVPEIMDRPGNEPTLLRADLRVLEGINRFLGGHRIPLLYLRKFSGLLRPGTLWRFSISLRARLMCRAPSPSWARSAKWTWPSLPWTAIRRFCGIARENTVDWPEIRIEQQNLLALPYPPPVFGRRPLLRHSAPRSPSRMQLQFCDAIHDIARGGWVVNDLRENRIAIGLSKLMAHTIITTPLRFRRTRIVRTRLHYCRVACDGRARRHGPFYHSPPPIFPHGARGAQVSVRTANSILIDAPLEKNLRDHVQPVALAQGASALSLDSCPQADDDGLIVRMGARRGWLPIQWTSRFQVDPNARELAFRAPQGVHARMRCCGRIHHA